MEVENTSDSEALVPEDVPRLRGVAADGVAAPLRIAIGIPTVGRPDVVIEIVKRLESQRRRPDRVLVCAPSPQDVVGVAEACPHVEIVFGPRGLCAQRNAILDALHSEDVVVFFDDDFVAAPGYLAAVEEAMTHHADVAMTTGNVLADGILGPGISLAEADRLVGGVAYAAEGLDRWEETHNGYGCNMSVRLDLVRRHQLRFDSHLPLYCWLEDVDFSRRLAAHGRIVKLYASCGVHMGVKSGRVPGKRLGYSQIANPIYLLRKGTLSFKRAAYMMTRNLLANAAKSLKPEPFVDRRGRLSGNLLAVGDLFRGRLDPARVLTLTTDKAAAAPALKRTGPRGGHPGGVEPERVVIVNDFSVARGGATGLALLSARLLSERGVPVTFITGDAGPGSAHDDLAKADVVAFGGRHILEGARSAAMARGLYDRSVNRRLSAWIAENDTPRTVYHLHGWSKILSPAALHALSAVGDRLVAHAHDFFLTCPNGGYFDNRANKPCDLAPLGVRCLATNCDRRNYAHKIWRSGRLGLLAATGARAKVARYLTVHPKIAPLLIQGGLPADRVHALRNPSTPWRAERVPAEQNQKFFFVGRLERDKGVLQLAEAARRAGAPLTLIGDGELDEALARDYPEVRRLGRLSREEVAEAIVEARALAMLTTAREAYGLVFFEAAMSGVPILASKYAMAAGELFENGLGLVVDPNDADGAAQALRRLATDDTLTRAMSEKAFATGASFTQTPAAWADQLMAHYRATLRESATAPVDAAADAKEPVAAKS